MNERDYTYYDFTISLCSHCLRQVHAKILFKDNAVYMEKRCREHGVERVLISTDIEYYKKCRNFMKPAEIPHRFNTEVKWGCPYDCGLCTDHEQHSCIALVEITERCNLSCPVCFTESTPTSGRHKSMDEVKKMLDIIEKNEELLEVLQLSGGEPTTHPQFFEILDEAKKRPINHIMVNTNGVRLGKEKEFVKRLKKYMPGFEIYLQFDSFKREAIKKIRGVDLFDLKMKALEHLNEYNLSTTLVVTLQKGVNDDEIGKILEFASRQPAVRGVTFQPIHSAGRLENFNPETERLTLSEVRQSILNQSDMFNSDDIIPVPCNPDALAMGYGIKKNGKIVPLTRYVNPEELLNSAKNTIVFEHDKELRKKLIALFSTAKTTDESTKDLKSLLCCLPKIAIPTVTYKDIFRVIIMQFIDAYSFDVRSIKKSCVHVVRTDGRVIPLETNNLFYRSNEDYLNTLRKEIIQ